MSNSYKIKVSNCCPRLDSNPDFKKVHNVMKSLNFTTKADAHKNPN